MAWDLREFIRTWCLDVRESGREFTGPLRTSHLDPESYGEEPSFIAMMGSYWRLKQNDLSWILAAPPY